MMFYWMRGALVAWLACMGSTGSPEADRGDPPAGHRSVIERFLIEGAASSRARPVREIAIDRWTCPIGAEEGEGEGDEFEDDAARDEMPLRDELEVLP